MPSLIIFLVTCGGDSNLSVHEDIEKYPIGTTTIHERFHPENNVLERHISDNGIIDDRLNSMEYQLNKLREEKEYNDKFNKISIGNIKKNTNNYEIYKLLNHFNAMRD